MSIDNFNTAPLAAMKFFKSPKTLRLLFLLASANSLFLWCVAIFLGDSDFALVDLTFFVQLQGKIVGVFILSSAIASILANFFRQFVVDMKRKWLFSLKVRKIYRFLISSWKMEIFIVCIGLTIFVFGFAKLVFLIIIGTIILLGAKRSDRSKKSESLQRFERIDEISPKKRSDFRRSISVLDRARSRSKNALWFSSYVLITFAIIQFAAGYAKQLKHGDPWVFSLASGQSTGVIVGQTGFGFLVWDLNDCECLGVISYAQFEFLAEKAI